MKNILEGQGFYKAMNHPKHVNEESQNELAAMIIADGEDPGAWRCRTCGAIYDGGQFCTYCGDHNPLDDPELEYEIG